MQGETLFYVVELDDHVIATLRAQPTELFAARFGRDTQPPAVKIAIHDVVSVVIWEGAAGGPLTESPPTLPPGQRRELSRLRAKRRGRSSALRAFRSSHSSGVEPLKLRHPVQPRFRLRGRRDGWWTGGAIPPQLVQSDGAISALCREDSCRGTNDGEMQQTIHARLANTALQPQAIVVVEKSFANTVAVTSEVVAGAQVPLSPGGDRLLRG